MNLSFSSQSTLDNLPIQTPLNVTLFDQTFIKKAFNLLQNVSLQALSPMIDVFSQTMMDETRTKRTNIAEGSVRLVTREVAWHVCASPAHTRARQYVYAHV